MVAVLWVALYYVTVASSAGRTQGTRDACSREAHTLIGSFSSSSQIPAALLPVPRKNTQCYSFCRIPYSPFYMTIENLQRTALEFHSSGHLPDAIDAYHQLSCHTPRPSRNLCYNLAMAVSSLSSSSLSYDGRYPEALVLWETLHDLFPNDQEVFVRMVESSLAYGSPTRHLKLLKRRMRSKTEGNLPILYHALKGAIQAHSDPRAAAETFKHAARMAAVFQHAPTTMKLVSLALTYQHSPYAKPKCIETLGNRSPPSPSVPSVAFVGLTVGGGAAQIKKMRSSIEALGHSISPNNYQVFILENDSKDGTKEALLEWMEQRPCVVHVDCIDIGGTSRTFGFQGMRTKVLAMMRNRAMRMARKHPAWPFDFVVSMDLDLEAFNHTSVIHAAFDGDGENYYSWKSLKGWNAVCANGIYQTGSHHSGNNDDYLFYDVYALRSQSFPFAPTDDESKIPFGSYWGVLGDRPYMYEMQVALTRKPGDPPVRVDSCFSGFAIYKGVLFDGCEYDAHFDCEHVFIHRCMLEKHGLRMYMLPDMKILYRLDEENLQQWEEVERNYRKRRKQSRRKIKPKNP